MSLENSPDLWRSALPRLKPDGHKYDRGHVIVLGAETLTGAACLAADGAMRIGAGLCTIYAPPETVSVYRVFKPYIMVRECALIGSFVNAATDPRPTAVVMGMGAVDVDAAALRQAIFEILALNRPTVLDAEALNVFSGNAKTLLAACHDKVVLTPHEGEFMRLFPELQGERVVRAQKAASGTKATIVLKGRETIVAKAGRDPVINRNAPPNLATAGAGDVLAGMIGGLMGQGMDVFSAACAGVWMHGDAAMRFGAGLVASDIVDMLPKTLSEMS
jgi:NAD(P)H-hydrate epimerase